MKITCIYNTFYMNCTETSITRDTIHKTYTGQRRLDSEQEWLVFPILSKSVVDEGDVGHDRHPVWYRKRHHVLNVLKHT